MRLIILSLILLTANLTQLSAQDVKFTGRAQTAVVVGDKFQLVYSLNKEGSDIRLPALQDFQILMGPSTSYSTSTTIVNGKVSRETSYTFTFILKALKEGQMSIPPASIMVDDKKVTSNTVSIKVVKGDAQAQQHNQNSQVAGGAPSDDDLFITVTPSKKNVYQGESLVLSTKIYTKVQLEGLSDINQPELSSFITQTLKNEDGIKWSMENINGRTYNVGTYEQKLLFPQKSGKLTIKPTEIEFMVRQRVARSRSRSIFDDFFESNHRTVKKRVKSKPLTINVKPLPSGRPEGYTGGVGQLNMKASVTKTDVTVNDGITLKVVVNGTGNHKFIEEPQIKFPADFDDFDAKITNGISNTTRGMRGSKTYEYLMIPRHAGTFTIPSIKFAYFDPAKGQYKTIESGNINLNVAKGEGNETASSGVVRSNVNKENVKFIGKDIRFINTNKTKLKPIGTFFMGSLSFYLALFIPLSLFILLVLINQKRIKDNSNITLLKTKKANKVAIKRLKKSANFLKAGEKEAFYEEVLRALWGYLSDKLSLPLSELSKDNAGEVLSQYQVSDELKSAIMEILDTCEFARYSPSSGTDEMDQLYKQTITTISKLENQIKR
ncbi:BatD family protein [Carboxylicivirga sp. M1479]|uniref:BatD family protein n=1 Tax=Carboxylicivirga sp. M1479 TaxID=2594476 RepID=UPI0011786008|nr:BatD family protein [Carboxylicivirga sp. M1479]TRX70319.1 protein BatD [Carboxylicivirga sp. M1479]